MAFILTSFLLASAAYAASSATSPTASGRCTATLDGKLPSATPSDFHFTGNVRRYYIAAEEIEWDYAPTGWDNWLGMPLDVSPRAKAAGVTRYGTRWTKAVYRGYTDSSFTMKSPQPDWQGIQGPTIRSEVGDMIEILFMNKLSQHYASMHSMGQAYSKMNEGAVYPNRTADANATPAPGDAVPPGGCVVYKWLVDESNAPAKGVPANMHAYHSYVSSPEDLNAGLAGPQMTYPRGMMNQTMSTYREFPVLYNSFNEANSFFSAVNADDLGNLSIGQKAGRNYSIPSASSQYGNSSFWHPQLVNFLSAQDFSTAPTFHAINGYIFGNNPTFKMCVNDKVIWYLYGES